MSTTIFASLSSTMLVLVTSLGYILATVGMKAWVEGLVPLGLALILAGFALAAVAEVLLLRQTYLSVIYVAIIGVETVLIVALATVIGEGLSARQVAGAILVLTGLAFVGT